jgi:UPF0716 protein FxsA
LRPLFLLFAILPIIEIFLLIQVGEVIGGWNTVGIVIITAFLGAYFVRQEGFSTLQKAQEKMQHNEVPGQEMVEGLMLVLAGVLLVTPGFVTDIFGFLLVLPGTRSLLAKTASKHISASVVTTQFTGQQWQGTQSPQDDSSVFEGEYTNKTENEQRPKLDK